MTKSFKMQRKTYRCLKMPAISNRWRQKTQGQLSPPTICLVAKKWTTQKTTKAWIVEGAGDGFEFLLALLVQNGIPCTYVLELILNCFQIILKHSNFFGHDKIMKWCNWVWFQTFWIPKWLELKSVRWRWRRRWLTELILWPRDKMISWSKMPLRFYVKFISFF